MTKFPALLLLSLLAAITPVRAADYDVHAVPLAGEAPMTLDYFAWDASTGRLWIPGGNTGYVFTLGAKSRRLTAVHGFQTAEFNRGTRRVRMGPSSATVGDGIVYIGSRADSNVCAVDTNTLELGNCVKLTIGMPDGIAYVAATKEVWVTMHGHTLDILDVSDPRTPREKSTLALGASAEGYAVDDKRGIFYTNLEETAETVAIDVRTKKITARWKPGCDNARGVAIDAARGFLFDACAGRVITIDTNQGGKVLGAVETGAGVDNIDYSNNLVYAAAGRAATLTIANVDDSGRLSRVALVPTVTGARSVVAGDDGKAYVIDPANGKILVVTPR
jgi:DNA-binding beta-propeller fold protein YncE